MNEYKEIRDFLKPRKEIKASDKLRGRVNQVIEESCRTRKGKGVRLAGGAFVAVAAVAAIVLLLPTRMTAHEVLAAAINSIKAMTRIEMVAEVRTRPVENFSFIDINGDFVEHRIEVANVDSACVWRVDKGGRTAMGNGADTYMWIKSLNVGWHYSDMPCADVLGYLSVLISPEKILEKELEQNMSETGAEYKVRNNGDEILLEVHSQPNGDFENPYSLNTSIKESENVRRYKFDASSKQLRSVSVCVIVGKKEMEVLRISHIDYDGSINLPEMTQLPTGVHFVECSDDIVQGLSGLSAVEAASAVLNAFKDWDTAILYRAIDPSFAEAAYKAGLKGATLLNVGQPFTSGSGDNIFVPYRLRLLGGDVIQHNLALRKLRNGGWIVTGGL